MACILCSSSEARVVSRRDRRGEDLCTWLCEGCGLVYNNPIPSDEELEEFYGTKYRNNYKGSDRPRGRQIYRNFLRLKTHLDTFDDVFAGAEDVLDVGAGSGEFAFAMAEMGKNVRGNEPNRAYSRYCREALGVDVETGMLDARTAEPGSCDLINLSHVLEHMNQPVEQLALLASFLKPDGLLYVEVPNILDYAATKSKGNLFHFGHIWNFSPYTLRAVAGLAGLKEYGPTAERCSGKTGLFLQRGDVVHPDPEACAENAHRVASALDTHFKSGPHRRRSGIPFTRFFTGVAETLKSLFRSPKGIGRAVLKSQGPYPMG